jgi:hypothetical protein
MTRRSSLTVLLIAMVVFSVYASIRLLALRDGLRARTCRAQRAAIEGAKEQYGIERDGAAPESFESLVPGYLSAVPVCPAGGVYTLGDLQTLVTCNQPGHTLPPETAE